MSILNAGSRQIGVSSLTIIGSLLIIAGVAGLGMALGNSSGDELSSASSAANGRTSAVVRSDAKRVAADAATTAGAKTRPQGSGPNPTWHGTWRGATPDAQMVITATGVGACQWIDAPEPRFATDCESGYAKSSLSLTDISRGYEESVAQFQRDPSDFSISDPAESRRLIGRIKPGNYRVIWTHDGSDCGQEKMIIDGDVMLRIVECKYRHQISLLNRVGVTAPAVTQGLQGAIKDPGVAGLPAGRWEGIVSQPGYGPYQAVMQLQPTPAGVPAGTMTYAGLTCTASLAFIRSEGDVFWFRESIIDGKGRCMDGGQIAISLISNQTMSWRYFAPQNLGSPMATGTLRR